MKTKIKKLETEQFAAERAYSEARDKFNEERRLLIAAATERIDDDLEEKSESLAQLLALRREAIERFNQAVEQEAMSGEGAPYPLGTKLYQWHRPGRGWDRRSLVRSGLVGIMSVWTRMSEYPSNVKYRIPSSGNFYVRILKADGTESKQFSGSVEGWHTEDWKPKE